MDQKKSVAGDIIMGFILIVSGIAIIINSSHMKVFRTFLDAPGFFPMILGFIFIILGMMLSIPAIRSNGISELKKTFSKSQLLAFIKDDKTFRVTVLLLLMIVYVFILIGKVHFTIATAIYLFFTMLYLKSTSWWKNLIISILASVLISVVFKYGFRIPLPM